MKNNITIRPFFAGLHHTTYLFGKRILVAFLLVFVLCLTSAKASINGDLTVRWQPNPPHENIIDYRLYYGSQSRYNTNGTPKANFSYDYFIDLTQAIRCNNLDDNAPCEALDYSELSCQNLADGSPSCTLSNLRGTLYFSLTACSTNLESGYTQEVRMGSAPNTSGPSQQGNIVPILQMLLLKS